MLNPARVWVETLSHKTRTLVGTLLGAVFSVGVRHAKPATLRPCILYASIMPIHPSTFCLCGSYKIVSENVSSLNI